MPKHEPQPFPQLPGVAPFMGKFGIGTGLRRLLVVNFLYIFVAAALAVMVPLYLVDRGIDMGGIGLILSLAPIAFLVLRILFASIADEAGTKAISFVYAVCNIGAVLIYMFAITPFAFALGTFAEGARASGFWAVARTDILLERGKGSAGKLLAYFSGMRQLADALGRIAIGFLIAWLSFQGSFALMLALAMAIFIIILSIRNGHLEFSFGRETLERIFRPRSGFFWHCAMGLTTTALASNMLLAFVFPLYLYQGLGMDYRETGGMVALFSLATAIAMLAFAKWGSRPNLMLFFAFLMAPALALLPASGTGMLLLLILVVAVGDGCANVMQEYVLTNALADSRDISTDVGVIFAPLRIGEFIFLALGGFVIMNWGYAPLFYVCAALSALFAIFCALNRGLLCPTPGTCK